MVFTHTLTVPLDLSRPLWQHADLFPPDRCCFLLDSAMDPGRLGRRSFLGGRPAALLTGKRTGLPRPGGGRLFRLELTVWRQPDGSVAPAGSTSSWTGDPYAALRRLQADYAGTPAAPHPTEGEGFAGGLVGYLGYEAAHAGEDLPDTGHDHGLPDLAFLVADAVAAEDQRTGRRTLTVTGRGTSPQQAEQDARQAQRRWRGLLAAAPPVAAEVEPPVVVLHGLFDRAGYCAAVERCRERILAGDVFEVCLTQRLEADLALPPWQLYRRLRAVNPAPFAAWLQFPGFQIVSASPERFLSLAADRTAESRPIKGTRPRGDDPAEDARLREELATSAKDRAENLMIVDLVRNDLGRVAEIGSVEVPELMVIEPYATVFQLVSTVRARLREECDALDLVQACYPGGSMTGAPKIAAMKIIDDLEPVKRGVYSGAIGYLDRRGNLDLSIVIRTLVCHRGQVAFGVGGAVTSDSDPDAEYDETLDKARALILALGGRLA